METRDDTTLADWIEWLGQSSRRRLLSGSLIGVLLLAPCLRSPSTEFPRRDVAIVEFGAFVGNRPGQIVLTRISRRLVSPSARD